MNRSQYWIKDNEYKFIDEMSTEELNFYINYLYNECNSTAIAHNKKLEEISDVYNNLIIEKNKRNENS